MGHLNPIYESVSKAVAKDCDWQTIYDSGHHKGMQCTHQPSGAIGIAIGLKSRKASREKALLRMIRSEAFGKWFRAQVEMKKRRHLANLVINEQAKRIANSNNRKN